MPSAKTFKFQESKHAVHLNELIKFAREVEEILTILTDGHLSTSNKDKTQFLWEVNNKIFNAIVIIENAVIHKDSLSIHLLQRYFYELSIITNFILSSPNSEDQAKSFLSFEQDKSSERKWTKTDYKSMIEAIQKNNPAGRFASHDSFYRSLSNLGHPTYDSFLLNRKGEEIEFYQILGAGLLIVGIICDLITEQINRGLFESSKVAMIYEKFHQLCTKVITKLQTEIDPV